MDYTLLIPGGIPAIPGMYKSEENLFEVKENEFIFQETCRKLKKHSFESPWKHCFPTVEATVSEFACAVHDLNVEFSDSCNKNLEIPANEINDPPIDIRCKDNSSKEFEMQLSHLKESLISVHKIPAGKHLNGIEIFNNICLSQMLVVCNALQTSFSTETTRIAFLNSILSLEKPLSLSIASALVKHIIFPQVFQAKQNSSRTLLAAVLKFSETYTKPVIDEIIVPCLNQPSLETLQLETLLKIVKSNLPKEYVSYCIRSILEHVRQIDNTFPVLQNLIEQKIHHENNLLESLTQAVNSWSLVCKKNVKFTKLLISILITYGSELNQQQIAVYDDVMKHNETIMKRAAENVIKQLKTA